MSKRAFRAALVVVVGSLLLVAVVAGLFALEVTRYPDRARMGQGEEVEVAIRRGMRFPDIAKELADRGVVERPTWFRLYAMHRGAANRVKAGEYTFTDDMTPRQVIDQLLVGVPIEDVAVTVPEGRNMLEVFDLIAAAGVAPADELEALGRDEAWLRAHGIDGPTVEGYLFPDTYRFTRSTSADSVLSTMVAEHHRVYQELAREHEASLERLKKRLDWDDHDVVIMASIVEKEAVREDERRTISSVFYNRLTLPGFTTRKLETDPTIRYGCLVPEEKSEPCKKWDQGRLRRIQLDDADNLYNTYQHPGLPPGPIGNPGRASISAAMNPETTKFLFFVAMKDKRTHVFSKTFAEHVKNVNLYQR